MFLLYQETSLVGRHHPASQYCSDVQSPEELERTRSRDEQALGNQTYWFLSPSGQLSDLRSFVSSQEGTETMQALC